MNILILGGGQVGKTVLAALNRGSNTITVVDQDPEIVSEVQTTFQCNAIHGHASSPEVLKKANVDDADAVVAVTASDDVNLVACRIACELFLTPICIARIRNIDYLGEDYQKLFKLSSTSSIQPISPELTIVEQLKNLVESPGSIYVEEFADRQAVITCTRILKGGGSQGLSALDFSRLSHQKAHAVGLLRDGKLVVPLHDAVFKAGDIAFILGQADSVKQFTHELTGIHKPYRHVVIAGGGIIGGNLARYLETASQRRHVKIIEQNPVIADKLGENLSSSSLSTAVLQGNAADEGFLADNDINDSDLYCAVTNNDLVNLVSSLTAKRLGVKSVITMVQNADHLDSWLQAGIEVPISPQQTTASTIQRLISERSLMALRHLPIFGLDLVELKVQGKENSSKVAGKTVSGLKLPLGAHFAGLIHGLDDAEGQGELEIHPVLSDSAHVIQANDRLIFISETTDATNKLERLFRPKATSLL